MTSSRDKTSERAILLGLLDAVERGDVTQRSLSRDLGIAVGLVNAYVKRCTKRGLIKVRQIPPRRYGYYLTPKGFVEKS
jgi:DNA-binding MarR family transcriptional regulator